ncbi:MAG: hypothetical protein ACOYOO_15120 [Saprospiraceae bacterium]
MSNEAQVSGQHNVVIQGVSESTITVSIDGNILEIQNELARLRELMESLKAQSFQTADKIYNIGSIGEANFSFVLSQAQTERLLPGELQENLCSDDSALVQSLREELRNEGVEVRANANDIFQYYGWIVETFLQKMRSDAGKHRNLRRLSFMAEAYHSTVRYLCYIQTAQVLQEGLPRDPTVAAFLSLPQTMEEKYDYLNLLVITTALLEASGGGFYVDRLPAFVAELKDTRSDLHRTALFLDHHRQQLIGKGAELEGENFDSFLDEYLTALIYWLRKLSFLAHYRLVSIKNINLNYRMGTAQNFVHLYGELHGVYNQHEPNEENYAELAREREFTYSKSVLLLKGVDAQAGLRNFGQGESPLSLSPLVIDQSVFTEKPTPEIYCYIGYDGTSNSYHYAHHRNELPYPGHKITSNQTLVVRAQNNKQTPLNDVFKQLNQLFSRYNKPGQ